ncbi:hypothetical protein [Pseudomonas oryzihabitans]|uniref:Uncharacterized protein n=1 Tax=Pseudomonas oryzihabitans TaxID=47885 RepID=A0A1G5MUV3_9PSED|nr:hypothetical protein [Pseudomonas psychrotolerans]NMY89782.1 hypothetical protein [Pseudomonas psychrotolerans]SCZ28604.1 hypothetical protein SAMN05216279_10380 [Pseudomonas psychrotolerans]
MDVDRPWPLKPVIDGVEYLVIFKWPSPAHDAPNKVAVWQGDTLLYSADIQAASQVEAEQIAVLDLQEFLKRSA